MNARFLAAGLFGAAAGAWIGRALFKWLLGFEGTSLIVAIVAFGAVGLAVAVAGEFDRERH